MSSWSSLFVNAAAASPVDRAEHAFERKATLVTVLALTLGFGACLGLWLLTKTDESEALRSLPRSERSALYQNTLHTLTAVCAPGSRALGLDDYCRGQARFVTQFPECDGSCQKLGARVRALPRR